MQLCVIVCVLGLMCSCWIKLCIMAGDNRDNGTDPVLFRHFMWTSFERPNITTDDVGYYVYQEERTPSTDRTHWQGYMEMRIDDDGLTKRMRIKTIQNKIFNKNKVHIDMRRGTQEVAIAYCKKCACGPNCSPECTLHCLKKEWRDKGLREPGTDVVEWGETKECHQGKKVANLQEFMEVTKNESMTLAESMERFPFIHARYNQFAVKYHRQQLKKRQQRRKFRAVDVTVLWGDTGVGKTGRVNAEYGDRMFMLDPPTDPRERKVWFDDYDNEDVLMIDEFYGWVSCSTLLRVLDGYVYRGPVKSSFTYGNWSKVFITSNVHPSIWYTGGEYGDNIMPKQRDALMRRLHNIVHVTEQWVPPPVCDDDAEGDRCRKKRRLEELESERRRIEKELEMLGAIDGAGEHSHAGSTPAAIDIH